MKSVSEMYPPRNRQPLEPDMLRTVLRNRAKEAERDIRRGELAELDSGYHTTIQFLLSQVCGYEQSIPGLLKHLFGVDCSFRSLSKGRWVALYCWIFPHMLDDCPPWCVNKRDTWHHHPALQAEVDSAYVAYASHLAKAVNELVDVLRHW